MGGEGPREVGQFGAVQPAPSSRRGRAHGGGHDTEVSAGGAPREVDDVLWITRVSVTDGGRWEGPERPFRETGALTCEDRERVTGQSRCTVRLSHRRRPARPDHGRGRRPPAGRPAGGLEPGVLVHLRHRPDLRLRHLSDTSQVRDLQVRIPQVRIPQVRASQVCTPQLRAPQVRGPQLRAPQVRAPQLRARQVRAPQVRAPQVRVLQVRAPQVRAPQVRALLDLGCRIFLIAALRSSLAGEPGKGRAMGSWSGGPGARPRAVPGAARRAACQAT